MIEFKGQVMTAKQYLKLYNKLDKLIEAMEMQLLRLYSKATKCTSEISPNGGGVGPSDKVGNNTVKLAALEQQIKDIKATYAEIKSDIIRCINAIPDYDERLLLIYRYCEGLDYRVIAHKLCYSERALFYMHGKALRSFDKVCSKLQ